MNIIKIMILFTLIFSTLKTTQLIYPLVYNYINYKNNIYIIISGSIFFISLRMELFIIVIINNIMRKRKKLKNQHGIIFNENKILDKLNLKNEEYKDKIE